MLNFKSKDIKRIFNNFSIWLMTLIFIFSMFITIVGLHDMDNGQNLRHINGIMRQYNTSIEFSEYSSMGSQGYTPDECYMIGFQLVTLGVFLLGIIGFYSIIQINKGYR